MIAYLDTSALVKACVEEAGTNQVLEHLNSADIAAAHEVAYVEARSAFARQRRRIVPVAELRRIVPVRLILRSI